MYIYIIKKLDGPFPDSSSMIAARSANQYARAGHASSAGQSFKLKTM